MILDEDMSLLIVKDKNIKLSIIENIILSLLIKNKNKTLTYEDILTYIYYDKIYMDKKTFNDIYNKYYGNLTIQIDRLNKKIFPYLKVCRKHMIGYYLEIEKYDEYWKSCFIKKYKQK